MDSNYALSLPRSLPAFIPFFLFTTAGWRWGVVRCVIPDTGHTGIQREAWVKGD